MSKAPIESTSRVRQASDHLSALPDDLLIRILVLVEDAAEAAQTSILASRWRRLWALLPELRFYYIEHHGIGAALAAHEAPDLTLLIALTDDPSPESMSAWLHVAARSLSGDIHVEVRREAGTEAKERLRAIDLPCFEKATYVVLNLGSLGLALPSSGVFARLKELQLIGIRLQGQTGLDDLLSPQRCPSLESLRVGDARGLDSINIHSETLVRVELLDLVRLQELTVMAPALIRLKVSNCFTDSLNPELSVANISAPHLTSLDWMNYYHPNSIQLGNVMHLESLGIQLYILDGEDEAFENDHYGMTLLQRFVDIHSLDLMISYPKVSTFFCRHCSVPINNEENIIEFSFKKYSRFKKKNLRYMPWYIWKSLTCFGLLMSLQHGLVHPIPFYPVADTELTK
jgi:hypothetical protein